MLCVITFITFDYQNRQNMKTTFFLTIFLIGLKISGQVTSTGTVAMTSIDYKNPYFYGLPPSAYICAGDTMTINFKFKPSGDTSTIPMWLFHYGFLGDPYVVIIRTFKYTEFYHLKKVFNGVDTIYSFKTRVPLNSPIGSIPVCVNSNNDSRYPGKNIEVQQTCIDGIKEYEQENTTPIYRDLYGQIIEPRKNEMIIEQRGNIRKKIIIQE